MLDSRAIHFTTYRFTLDEFDEWELGLLIICISAERIGEGIILGTNGTSEVVILSGVLRPPQSVMQH